VISTNMFWDVPIHSCHLAYRDITLANRASHAVHNLFTDNLLFYNHTSATLFIAEMPRKPLFVASNSGDFC
ncbi:hypothetical protein, partial [Lactobacillus jensenii]|uniref:hypothetical protein n=1 Tax=Lactobacillus jensenii TaxID=109790 RepID=UPI00254E7CA3